MNKPNILESFAAATVLFLDITTAPARAFRRDYEAFKNGWRMTNAGARTAAFCLNAGIYILSAYPVIAQMIETYVASATLLLIASNIQNKCRETPKHPAWPRLAKLKESSRLDKA